MIVGRRGQLILVGDNLITRKKSKAEIIPNNFNPNHLNEEQHHSPKMKSKHRKIEEDKLSEPMTKKKLKLK